jgi:hypothetical protein
MTATLTITLSDEILKALQAEKSITVALESGGRAPRATRPAPASRSSAKRPARTRRAAGAGAAKETPSGASPFRAGSLPAKLLSWAGGRKEPFGVQDVMNALKVKRSHASMVLTVARRKGAVKRVGRGEYAAA